MPFSLEDAREQLKNEEESSDDALITALVLAAGDLAEDKTNRAFMQSTWRFIAEDFPEANKLGFVVLRPGPLVSVSSVKYYPSAGGARVTMVEGTDYEVDTNNTPGRIRFLNSLPAVADRYDAVEIIFVAGYGSSGDSEEEQQAALADECPKAIAWMKLQLGTLYAVRQEILAGQVTNVRTFTDSLIYPYII